VFIPLDDIDKNPEIKGLYPYEIITTIVMVLDIIFTKR
jgi:hypothetical protein